MSATASQSRSEWIVGMRCSLMEGGSHTQWIACCWALRLRFGSVPNLHPGPAESVCCSEK